MKRLVLLLSSVTLAAYTFVLVAGECPHLEAISRGCLCFCLDLQSCPPGNTGATCKVAVPNHNQLVAMPTYNYTYVEWDSPLQPCTCTRKSGTCVNGVCFNLQGTDICWESTDQTPYTVNCENIGS